jgi:hypothetical protein
MCHLLLARAKWLGGSSRLVAYLIRFFRMPVARDERPGSLTELKSLEIPDALAILKERNHSVLADSEDASEARGGDSGRSTTAFNVLGVQVRQVRVTENRAEC